MEDETKIGFYADENVSAAVIEGIRRRGIFVLSTPEAGMLAASDEEHFELASTRKLVILTQDDDFLALAARAERHYGIVYARQGKKIGAIVSGAVLIAENLEASDMENQIEYI